MSKRKEFLPFALPLIGREEIREVVKTLQSGWLTTGPRTHQFEEEFKKYTGAEHAVALNSCTAGLNLALAALDLGPGDEVITSTLTFAATGNMIAIHGARPVLVDIEPKHFNIDPARIEKKITRRTKAIVAVHYAGHPCDLDAINRIAKKHKLKVVEDAAHAVGADYKGKKIGSGANVTCFSFYPIKNMTTGEGGMVTTDSAQTAERIRILSLHGISKDAWKRYKQEGSWYYEIVACGNKYNFTDLQAAIGLGQLKKLEKFLRIREQYAAAYNKAFAPLPEIVIPAAPAAEVRQARHLYPILLNPARLKISRNQFIDELKNENIGTSVHFIPLHLHPYYRQEFRYKEGDFPVAENIYSRIISLPLYPKMTARDLSSVITAVKTIIQKYRR